MAVVKYGLDQDDVNFLAEGMGDMLARTASAMAIRGATTADLHERIDRLQNGLLDLLCEEFEADADQRLDLLNIAERQMQYVLMKVNADMGDM